MLLSKITGGAAALAYLLPGTAWASPAASALRGRQSATFTNPIVWEDMPDADVFRVGDVFYYSSSTFAQSPGAPLYKSYNLVDWAPVTHSVPTLDFGSKYNLNSATDRAYVSGIWASTVRYRQSTDTFYWIGCVDFSETYIYTSPGSGAGTKNGEVDSWSWQQSAVIDTCYYDCGLLIDEDDTMYVVYGNSNISIAQLSGDGLSEVTTQQVYSSGDIDIEGSHLYKINGYYWIVPTKVATGEWVLRSTSPWGPYEQRVLFDELAAPLVNAGWAHQGGLVDTKANEWYYIAFLDSYPGGRIPVMAPIAWDVDGWPQLVTNSTGGWGYEYPLPVTDSQGAVPPLTGTDYFTGSTLSDEWEWNHNPDTTKWDLLGGSGGLVLQTATVTEDLFTARNTLTHRIIGPRSEAIFKLDISQMADGDRAGVAMFRDQSAYIGIHKTGDISTLVYLKNATLADGSWTTSSLGYIAATGPTDLPATVYLRISADITPAFGLEPNREAIFSYSIEGSEWTQLGDAFLLNNSWTYFLGYRYAVFNFATEALGGWIVVESFTMNLTE